MTSPLLELDQVTKRFGRVVIAEKLSLSVGAGDTVGIVGPNGAGKTSLFGLISGDLSPNAGDIAVIWIEHVVRALTPVVSRLICLAGGAFVGDGDPEMVLADPAVREVFLGSEVTASLTGSTLSEDLIPGETS